MPATVQRTLDRVFLTSLATRHIDYSSILPDTLLAEENRLVPEYVEDYFLRAFRRLGGSSRNAKSKPRGQSHATALPTRQGVRRAQRAL